LQLIPESSQRLPMRLLSYCVMTNHFHRVLFPHEDGDLSSWMHWLMTAHVRRYHRHYGTSGHVWQGRFKAFPIQQDEHLLTIMRYVEPNPVRARIVRLAQRYPWSSIAKNVPMENPPALHPGPVKRDKNWIDWVNTPLTEAELETVRKSVHRGTPYGTPRWQKLTAKKLGLESSLRPRGRPRKTR
jgi:putative transposase